LNSRWWRSFIIEREKDPEPTVQSCLEGVGISAISEWDVLAFLHRHRTSLASADQIARLLGYDSAVVGGALDRLERNLLIERSRTSRGVRLYRILALSEVGLERSLRRLISLSESRSGRLILTRQLQSARDGCRKELESAGA
jgi:DNA-binding MarR family transcriptional regulator